MPPRQNGALFGPVKVGDCRVGGAGVDVVGEVLGEVFYGSDLVELNAEGLRDRDQLEMVVDLLEMEALVLQ